MNRASGGPFPPRMMARFRVRWCEYSAGEPKTRADVLRPAFAPERPGEPRGASHVVEDHRRPDPDDVGVEIVRDEERQRHAEDPVAEDRRPERCLGVSA